MKKITDSVYTFEDLIKDRYLYVDKTEYIWNLVGQGKGMYFLARPRRFGKSLTLSTLKAIFEGKKELFKGLAIYDKPYDWKPYPVIHLDMENCSIKTQEELKLYLVRLLESQCKEHQVQIKIQKEVLSASFADFIDAVAGKGQVVILLDEYDKALLNTLTTSEDAVCRDVLRGFYSTIKKCESKERFVFVTGVSKFCHVSLFSDLNNLSDISMLRDYATMFGYTEAELEKYFADRIDLACEQLKLPRAELLSEIAAWYDGYRFEEESPNVYNPVSLARFFISNCKFGNYWFDKGTPSFLVKLAKERNFDFERVLTNPVPAVAFSAYEVDSIDPLVLLLQTGYLTIKSTTRDFGILLYQLGFPNREVEAAFNTYLLNCYTAHSREEMDSLLLDLARAVRSGEANHFMELWQSFLADIPYDIQLKHEKYYQTIFYTVFRALKFAIQAECRTSKGRIDAVVSYGEWVYVIEFKLDKTAEIALEQIKKNQYFLKYCHSGKKIVLIGANFDFKERQLTDWKIEALAEE